MTWTWKRCQKNKPLEYCQEKPNRRVNFSNVFKVMKRLIFSMSILTLLIGSGNSIAQTTEPFKGSKIILITCADSSEALFTRRGKHFTGKGIFIESSNKDFLTMKTAPIETTKYNIVFTVNSIITDNRIRVTVGYRINSPSFSSTFEPWGYEKGKGSVQNVIWVDVVNLLTDFDKISLTYQWSKWIK